MGACREGRDLTGLPDGGPQQFQSRDTCLQGQRFRVLGFKGLGV